MRTIEQEISALVEVANRRRSISFLLTGWDRLFVLRVGDYEIGIESSGGRARVVVPPPRQGDVWFGLSERTLDLLISGRLSPFTARVSGRLQSKGPVADILRFASVFTACVRQRRVLDLVVG